MIPTLRTKRLVLRPFASDDATPVQHLAGHADVAATTLTIPHPYEDGVAEEWMKSHLADWEAKTNLVLAITTQADGVIGAIGLRLEMKHYRGELGYWIGVPYWNQGYATEAAGAVVKFGFEQLDLKRIDAHYLANNPASGKVMAKLGMQYEGVLRQHIVKLGVAHDVVLYGILAAEYKPM